MEKIDRKELKKDDAFVRRGKNFLAAISQRRERFVPVLIGALILVVGVYVFDWWAQKKLEQAWVEYHRIEKLTGVEKTEAFKTFCAKEGATRAGSVAAISLADYYFQESKKNVSKSDGKSDESAKEASRWYTKGLEYKGLLPSEKQLVLIDRGSSFELAQLFDEAEKDYKQALETSGDAKGLAGIHLGLLYEVKKDPKNAELTYKKVATDHPDSEYAKTAKSLLRRMTSPLFGAT